MEDKSLQDNDLYDTNGKSAEEIASPLCDKLVEVNKGWIEEEAELVFNFSPKYFTQTKFLDASPDQLSNIIKEDTDKAKGFFFSVVETAPFHMLLRDTIQLGPSLFYRFPIYNEDGYDHDLVLALKLILKDKVADAVSLRIQELARRVVSEKLTMEEDG